MRHRMLVSLGALAIFIATVLWAPVHVAGPTSLASFVGVAEASGEGAQARSVAATPAAPAKDWTVPRLPDGQPDLQGFWANATYTPLERPADVTKEFYTPEEVVDIEKRAAERERQQTVPGTIPDVHYDFTQFGLDRSQGAYASSLRTSMIVDPPDGRIPPVTPEGQERAARRAEARKRMGGPFDGPDMLGLGARCIIMGADPPLLPEAYNNTLQIVQTPGYVMILVEMIHDVRIIPLDGRPHLPQSVRVWMGDSRGRWEGETLVVETTNFTDKNPFRGSSENMRVIERFTRVDEHTIRYEFTVDDPATWARPWSAEFPVKKTVGPIFEHACHEGNYGLANILRGARAEEKRAAEEAAKKGSK